MRFYKQSTVSKRTLKDILSKNTDYSEEEIKDIVEEIFEIDPDKKNHKNSAWIAKQYRIADGRLPDNLTDLLAVFNLLCDRNRIKDKELKNYSIDDLQDVVTREAKRGISRKDELEKREKEGLKEMDRLGEFVLYYATDYDVWKNRINQKMKEGYECGWCIKDPAYWNKISKDDYLYVEKNGQPWIIADNNSGQCKDYQDKANPENIMQCAYLLYKNGLDFSDDFKKEYLYGDKNTPEKIKNEILKEALENSYKAFDLLYYKTITKSDGEIFNNVVEKLLEKSSDAYELLSEKIITKSDGEIYYKVLNKAIEDSEKAYKLLDNRMITKGDGEIFNKAVEKVIKDLAYAYRLINENIITKEDGELFNKAVEKAIENSFYAYFLLYNKIIKKLDVPPELWEEALTSAERYNPDVRQKFAGRRRVSRKFYRLI